VPTPRLLLATANKKKILEMEQILTAHGAAVEIVTLEEFDVPEPEETGNTFRENAELKARYYSMATGLPSLADDSGLVVDALDGRPGVHSSRYAPTDDERIARLLRELDGVADADRSARFECVMALAQGNAILATSRGTLEGRIALERRGTHGFGYDPVFYTHALQCHLAEASPEEKNRVSHRGKALEQMVPSLLRLLS